MKEKSVSGINSSNEKCSSQQGQLQNLKYRSFQRKVKDLNKKLLAWFQTINKRIDIHSQK